MAGDLKGFKCMLSERSGRDVRRLHRSRLRVYAVRWPVSDDRDTGDVYKRQVLQSAGRVIRTESDRGVILLLDDRFRAMRYREAVSYTHLVHFTELHFTEIFRSCSQ